MLAHLAVKLLNKLRGSLTRARQKIEQQEAGETAITLRQVLRERVTAALFAGGDCLGLHHLWPQEFEANGRFVRRHAVEVAEAVDHARAGDRADHRPA